MNPAMRRAPLFVAAILAGCGFPSYEVAADATSDSSADAAHDAIADDVANDAEVDGGSDAPSCPILTGGDVCTAIAPFTAAAQIVDGVGDEFCNVPATVLQATNGALMTPNPPPTGVDTVAKIRAAWDATALRIHVHVDQASVNAPGATDPIWTGDAIEIFAAGFSNLTGAYDGTNDAGAVQIIVSPPAASGDPPARGETWANGALIGVFPSADFAARLVDGGYEVELKLDWSTLKGAAASGVSVGFDLAVDVRGDASKPPLLQSFVGFRPQSPTSCGSDHPNSHPSCDDRTWCTPSLQ